MKYTGIGARKTPTNIINDMIEIGKMLGGLGFTLRSGGADGADSAFEFGCDQAKGKKEIYLPWRNFNNNKSELFNIKSDSAENIAREVYGPRWNELNSSVKKLMTRNVHQVLGENTSNVQNMSAFLICWTPDGCESTKSRGKTTGGTGQAISLAHAAGVPVLNLYNDDALDRLEALLEWTKIFEL